MLKNCRTMLHFPNDFIGLPLEKLLVAISCIVIDHDQFSLAKINLLCTLGPRIKEIVLKQLLGKESSLMGCLH